MKPFFILNKIQIKTLLRFINYIIMSIRSIDKEKDKPQHWLLRIGDGKNFHNSSKHHIWGIKSNSIGRYFMDNVKPNDILWFINNKSKGKVMAVATFIKNNTRELGPLIDITMDNKELGWEGDDDWNIEIHYEKLYGLEDCHLFTHIKSPLTIRIYNSEKCNLDLPTEYHYIKRYRNITSHL